MPIPGDPDAVLAAAEELITAATGLQGVREGLAGRGRAVTADWSGRAASTTIDVIERHAAEFQLAVDAVARSAAPLARYADALRAAQRDHALGEQMVGEGEAALAGAGSGALPAADAVRYEAVRTVTDGHHVMESARDRALEANAIAARALADATAGLAAIAPRPALGPVVGRDGTLGDGLVKAVGDVADEAVDSVSGLATLLNPFSAGFGAAWATTWETVKTTVSDPVGAGRAVVEGTVAPVGESYSTGGLDEAIGRTPAVLAGVVGTKGLTKLLKLRRLRNETETPLAPGGGLQHHEDAGGHTLAPHKVHIGTDEQALFDRVRISPHIQAASSYFDRGSAERSVHESLSANRVAIDQWLSGANPKLRVNHQHDDIIGMSLRQDAMSPADAIEVQGSRTVLVRDPSMPGGYYVLTSFPTP